MKSDEVEANAEVAVSLRMVERAVAPFRRLLTAEAKATVRFETPPGRQLQIDFGQLRVPIAGERERVYLFVATLGYSRRCHVAAFRHERQSSWLRGLEGAFGHFGDVPRPRACAPYRARTKRNAIAGHRFESSGCRFDSSRRDAGFHRPASGSFLNWK